MSRKINEFHCIMPLENISSVLKHGILSHHLAAKVRHHSVAMEEVQDRRDVTQVPGGLKLHHYANLYFHARNPMLYKRKAEAGQLCVLQVSTEVRKLEGVVFSDCNASSDYVRFFAPEDWRRLDLDAIYAHDWRHPDDPIAYQRHKSRKCAEVLVPHRVEPDHLLGAYVVHEEAAARLTKLGFSLPIIIEPDLFFW